MPSAEMAALIERALFSLQQNEKINSTKSFCKFISCGGTCGRPECEERARNFDFFRIPSAKVDKYVHDNLRQCGGLVCEVSFRSSPKVDNGFGAMTGMPHLPAPAEPAAKSETNSEARSDDSNFVTSKNSEPPIIIELSSDSQESSSSRGSNVITSNDSNPRRIIEMSKHSPSPHKAWKSLRINADWPSSSRGKSARQVALRSKIARGVRLIKNRDLTTY